MKRLLLPIVVLASLLALPGVASARVKELGADAPAVRSKCPGDPCLAIGRVTGYQGRAAGVRNPFVIPRAGRIVAFTVKLAELTSQQRTFFDDLYGGEPSVRLAILRKGKRRRSRLNHRLLTQSKTYEVGDYFGSTPSFALSRPLRVRKGHIVALTVPTWAPVLAYDLPRTNWWRSSRRPDCTRDVTQRAAQTRRRGVRRYRCTYRGARLTYTATYVPDPRPTGNRR